MTYVALTLCFKLISFFYIDILNSWQLIIVTTRS